METVDGAQVEQETKIGLSLGWFLGGVQRFFWYLPGYLNPGYFADSLCDAVSTVAVMCWCS